MVGSVFASVAGTVVVSADEAAVVSGAASVVCEVCGCVSFSDFSDEQPDAVQSISAEQQSAVIFETAEIFLIFNIPSFYSRQYRTKP